MSWRTLAALAALALGCSVKNTEHCFYNGGDAACGELDGVPLYCSKCVGENNGCVLEPVTDPMCAVGTGGDTSTSTPATSTGPTTGTGAGTSSSTSTGLPMETSGSSGATGTTGTTDATTTTGATTGTTGTTDMTSGTGSTSGGPMCGNGKREVENQEGCDGMDFGGETCVSSSDLYGGGKLICSADCEVDFSDCCYKTGIACQTNDDCCAGLKCQLIVFKCG